MPVAKQVKLAIVVGLNLVLFYFLYRWVQTSIRWEQFSNAFLETPVAAILVALVVGLFLLVLYGLRLGCLIDRPLSQTFWIICYGFGANNLLPFRIGDALKLYFAKRRYEVSMTRLLLVKVMEKFFDLFFLLVIGLLALFLGVIAVSQASLLLIFGLLIAVVVGAALVILLIGRNYGWLESLRRHPLVDHFFVVFEEVIRSPSKKQALLISVAIWILTVAMMKVFYAQALPGYEIAWRDALALVFVTTITLGLPSAPGAIGVFEAAIVFYLSGIVGVPAEQALASAVVLHLIVAVPQILFMLIAAIGARGHAAKGVESASS